MNMKIGKKIIFITLICLTFFNIKDTNALGLECVYNNPNSTDSVEHTNTYLFKVANGSFMQQSFGSFQNMNIIPSNSNYEYSENDFLNVDNCSNYPKVYYACKDFECYVSLANFNENRDGFTYGTWSLTKEGEPGDYNPDYSYDEPVLVATYLKLTNNQKILIKRLNISTDFSSYDITLDGKGYEISNFNSYDFSSTSNSDNYPKYIIKNGETLTFADSEEGMESSEVFILSKYAGGVIGLGGEAIENTCQGIFGDSLIRFLKNNVFRIIYIAIPILLLVLTTLDFAKITFKNDKDDIPNAFKRFWKRCLAAILIYFTPSILILFINILGVDEVEKCIQTFKTMETEISKN